MILRIGTVFYEITNDKIEQIKVTDIAHPYSVEPLETADGSVVDIIHPYEPEYTILLWHEKSQKWEKTNIMNDKSPYKDYQKAFNDMLSFIEANKDLTPKLVFKIKEE